MGDGLNLGGCANMLVRCETALGIDQVGSKDRVDQSRLSETSLTLIVQELKLAKGSTFPGGHRVQSSAARTNANDVELESTLQELPLNLRGDAVETDMALREDSGLSLGHDGSFVGGCCSQRV